MARYKPYDLNQDKFIAVSYVDQILPGTFEHTLNELVENDLDLSVFEARYLNDRTGRPAYDPAILLKIVLYGYYKGIISSRKLEETCRRNVVFMALSADTRPHFTTIAAFVSYLENEIVELFRDVLLYCSELGLVGKEHFAIDGCKLPSNASKQWSGTHAELAAKQKKMERAARRIVQRHRARDAHEKDGPAAEQDEKKLAAYRSKIKKIKGFLATGTKNTGPSGKERKSNITDPDSAKMATSHGVIQGYNGVAVVDERHQIVVHAEAMGEGQENHLLEPMVEATRQTFDAIGEEEDVFAEATVSADSGFHSKQSMEYVTETGLDAYVADRAMRRRDPAFADAGRYNEPHRKEERRRSGRDGRSLFGVIVECCG
jgi:transposase